MAGNRFSMQTIQIAGGSFLILCLASIAGFVFAGYLQRDAERLVLESLQAHGRVGLALVNSRLSPAWATTIQLAKMIDVSDPKETLYRLTLLRESESRWLWLGVADLEGRIVTASGGTFEGQRASEMSWFRRGLIEPSGDQLDTGLFSKSPKGTTEAPDRSIILSAPLRVSGPNVTGVLAMQISWSWLTEQIATFAVGDVETLLVARDNSILFGPAALMGKRIEADTGVSTDLTKSLSRIERWPDGKDYATMAVSSAALRDLPNFGWRIVLRQDLKSALAPTRALVRQFWTVLIAATILSILILVLGTVWLAQPLRRLIRFGNQSTEERAIDISREETRYQEVAQLSAILSRLQLSMMVAKASELRTTSADQQVMRLVPPSDRVSN